MDTTAWTVVGATITVLVAIAARQIDQPAPGRRHGATGGLGAGSTPAGLPDERMLAEVIQAAAERGLGRVHREPNQPRNSPSRSARRAGHEGGHRNGSGRSGGNRRAVAEAAGERGDRNPGGADRTGRRANRARTALATSPLPKRTSAVSLAGLVFASTMSSPRARSSATRSSRASATCLPNAARCSTARASRSTCARWSAAR